MMHKIKIAQMLQQYTDKQEFVEVEGSTVKECLDNLVKRYPGTQKWIFDANNAPLVMVLLNNELVIQSKMADKKMADNDKITLILVIGGG